MKFPRRHRSGDTSAQPTDTEGATPAVRSTGEPFPGYDSTDERELVDQLFRHSQAELEAIEAYERSHGSRTRVLNKLHYLRQHEPWPGYDAMSSDEVAAALEDKDLAAIKGVRAYERKFANRLQVQERLTAEVANCIWENLKPQGVAVVIEATHGCMTGRGVRTPNVLMKTSRMLGVFRDDEKSREEVLKLIDS